MVNPESSPSLTAVLIVKNEGSDIGDCVASLANAVDEVVVYDTGSTDDTVALARAEGAAVFSGPWTSNFGAARNAALAHAQTEWVLSIDADERLACDRALLRAALFTTSAHGLSLTISVEHDESPYDFPAVRLFRPVAAQWAGAVHEQVVARRGSLEVEHLDSSIAALSHNGYATSEQRKARAVRNKVIAEASISTAAGPDADRQRARGYVDLGRSCVALEDGQGAADAFEFVRSNFAGTPEWVEATDFLARLVLADAMFEATLVLVQQLSESGASRSYCDWLAAQALVQMGRYAEANRLLNGVGAVIDTSGRQHSPEAVSKLKFLVAQLHALNPGQ